MPVDTNASGQRQPATPLYILLFGTYSRRKTEQLTESLLRCLSAVDVITCLSALVQKATDMYVTRL